MIEIRFDKTKDEVALLIWFLVDHSVLFSVLLYTSFYPRLARKFSTRKNCFFAYYRVENGTA
jgi:hypothetical protein